MWIGNKKDPGKGLNYLIHRGLSPEPASAHLNDFPLVIRAAALADTVRHHQGTAFAAFHQRRDLHFPIRPPLVPAALG